MILSRAYKQDIALLIIGLKFKFIIVSVGQRALHQTQEDQVITKNMLTILQKPALSGVQHISMEIWRQQVMDCALIYVH